MDCTLISGIIGVVLLFKIKGSYGQTNTSVFNITTTDKPYSKNEDEGPSPVLIAGPVIGGLIVIWVVTMMCRDCYHKKQLKCFFDIVCCVHCKECKERRVKARAKLTNKNNRTRIAPVLKKSGKVIDEKENNTNHKTDETGQQVNQEGHSSLKTQQAKHKKVTFKNSRDLSPPRMTSFQTNVESHLGTFSGHLPPIESVNTSDNKADDRSKNLHSTYEHSNVPNWDDLLKSSNNTPRSNLEGLSSMSDGHFESYNNSKLPISTISTDISYVPAKEYEPAMLNVDFDRPTTTWYVDDIPSEASSNEDPGPASYMPQTSNEDDVLMTDDLTSLSSATGDLHYLYPPPPDPPPPPPRTFARTPPPPHINVIIQDISTQTIIPKAPPPSYDDALFYDSEPK